MDALQGRPSFTTENEWNGASKTNRVQHQAFLGKWFRGVKGVISSVKPSQVQSIATRWHKIGTNGQFYATKKLLHD